MMPTTRNLVFVLGCERSGSTWLSNIFDSHPDVEFFMEPFADYAEIFRGVPERNIYIPSGSAQLRAIVEDGVRGLTAMKYSLLYNRNRPVFLKLVDRVLLWQYSFLYRHLRMRPVQKASRHALLNLNTAAIPVRRHFRKNANASVWVIKDLRLALKVGLLSQVFPNAKYVVSIRDPGAQIVSILNLFKRGSLVELRKALPSFIECIQDNDRFRKYHELYAHFDWANDVETMLTIWWMINYNTLLEDLSGFGLEHMTVRHEIVSENPQGTVRDVLRFCGLDMDPQVESYVSQSSTSKQRVASPVDTYRSSAEYSKKMILSVPTALRRKIGSIFSYGDDSLLHDTIMRSYESLQGMSHAPGTAGGADGGEKQGIEE